MTALMRKMARTEERVKERPTHVEVSYHIMATPMSDAYETT
jgi:hypothetical protein